MIVIKFLLTVVLCAIVMLIALALYVFGEGAYRKVRYNIATKALFAEANTILAGGK